jgi:hypothetical protein
MTILLPFSRATADTMTLKVRQALISILNDVGADQIGITWSDARRLRVLLVSGALCVIDIHEIPDKESADVIASILSRAISTGELKNSLVAASVILPSDELTVPLNPVVNAADNSGALTTAPAGDGNNAGGDNSNGDIWSRLFSMPMVLYIGGGFVGLLLIVVLIIVAVISRKPVPTKSATDGASTIFRSEPEVSMKTFNKKEISASPISYDNPILSSMVTNDKGNTFSNPALNKKKGPPPAPGNKPSNKLPPGWSELVDPSSGSKYYYNVNSGESRWDKPLS